MVTRTTLGALAAASRRGARITFHYEPAAGLCSLRGGSVLNSPSQPALVRAGDAAPLCRPAPSARAHGLNAPPGGRHPELALLRSAQTRERPRGEPRGRQTNDGKRRLEAEARADPDDARAQDLVDATERRAIPLPVHLHPRVPPQHVQPLRPQ